MSTPGDWRTGLPRKSKEIYMRNGALHEPIQDLRKDLHTIARDAEALLRATAGVSGDRIQEARARTEETLRRTLDQLYDRRLRKQARKFARTTDSYVRDHSWALLGAVAGAALIVGFLASRRR
jgi:ElaB/YqjD/DUF883 family membrane-anchored ribosome-binding protein